MTYILERNGERCVAGFFAGFIANLYCFTYESDFLRRMVQDRKWDVARQLLNCSRYVDDLLAIGTQDFNGMKYLPKELLRTEHGGC
jgi:hypothetical protein